MNIRKIQSHAVAAVAALALSTFFVGAAIGPAAAPGAQTAAVAAHSVA